MAIDRQLKRKKDREEREKARREAVEEAARKEKTAEYRSLMNKAYEAKDYGATLKWSLKILEIQPADDDTRHMAIYCAYQLKDMDAFHRILEEGWNAGVLTRKDHLMLLGEYYVSEENYPKAVEVLRPLMQKSPGLTGSLPHQKADEVTKLYQHAVIQMMLSSREMYKKTRAKESKARKTPPATTGKVPHRESAATSAKSSAPPPQEQKAAPEAKTPVPESLPRLRVVFDTHQEPVLEAIEARQRSDPAALELALRAYRFSFRTSYDQLICLPTLRNIQSFWYQEETARKVMKNFRGRAILADEVGLGKTIEAGLILKEYMMRGLVRSALILTPSSLVHQWQGELGDKFDIPFVSTNDPLFKQDPDRFWKEPFILASIQTAKTRRHFETVTARTYDMVIVDEAHHVKNRTTLNWKLVNAIQKTFLLMLTATPVQNSLEELYNLVTLLRPGHLKTQKAFKEEFVTKGNPTDPRNREKLRGLLKEVMVRNTRSVTQLHLPPRFATTVRIAPSRAEEEFYQAVSGFVSEQASGSSSGSSKLTLRKLLEAAGSSHAAALRMLERMEQKGEAPERVAELLAMGRRISMGAKAANVVELLNASPDQKIIFVNYTATLEHLEQILRARKIPYVVFQGSLTAAQKQEAIEAFRGGRKVLLATGTGGEGHNLQFCHVMLNYDLPWNPMEIEQRIGRIHRIGQEKEVQVYNFCASGSIEDHILDVLDRKINMFELVVGEMDMILGRLQGEEEFSDLVYEIWVKHPDEAERKKAFDALAVRLKRARSAYEKSRELDEKLFQEDFGV
ncbi:DEAD/DEAH box helicase [Desulforhabdus amnigena]|uniref:ATP-dependent helicase n=1 Tax=Desulforhabdus amnigena TaxID=40218 RepID=A0A9W6D3R0_9BACT|nr:SNF2-related protein [Desulforhabdus amnigena]GLI34013.1 hypothetical protein DAMNIGENAA_14460 [Desulforhabdus amnigena]